MYYAECGISTTYNLRNIRCGKKLAEFSTVCSATKDVVCYLLNKRMATFTIVPYCQQITEHSAPVIPEVYVVEFRIPYCAFRKVFSPFVKSLARSKQVFFGQNTSTLNWPVMSSETFGLTRDCAGSPFPGFA